MLKKTLSLLLFASLLLCMTGCRSKEPEEKLPDGGTVPDQSSVKTVTAGDVKMDYTMFGRGSRTFVIIPGLSVHSVMGSADAVAEAYSSFADDYTVYLFDVAENISEGCTMEDLAEYTAKAMEALGLKNADIFGVSQGGMMAQCIAIDHPELVHSLILGSTLSRSNPTFTALISDWIRLAEEKDEPALLKSFVDNVYSEATVTAYGDMLISSNQGISDEEYRRFLIQANAIRDFDCYSELQKIQCPVLVLGSEGDKAVTPEGSREIAEVLGCEIYMYGENYGHGVYDEAPDYKQRCLDFLTKNA